MARIVKDYDERFTEFLDTAQTLFFQKGYASTSVQEIIKTIGVAKGTFYHYFNSKADILEAIVERIYAQTLIMLETMINDSTLNAIQKLQKFFGNIGQWKTENKALILETARALYRDENILLREKMRQEAAKSTIPVLAKIIEEGVQNDLFDVEHPHEVAEVIFSIPRIFTEEVTSLILTEQFDEKAYEHVRRQLEVCNRSMERVLGMKANTLNIFEIDGLSAWLEE